MFSSKPSQYQPLQPSPLETSHYTCHNVSNHRHKSTSALAFIIMIMLVAMATLLTIIRLTVSPGFSMPSHLASISTHDSENDLPLLAEVGGGVSVRKNVVSLETKAESNIERMQVKARARVPSSIRDLLAASKNEKPSGPIKNSEPTNSETSDVKIKSSSSSPMNPAITSLTADQRFEKEYRDEISNITEAKANAKQAKPKLIFDASDLNETSRMKIDKVNGCGELEGGYADLAIVVFSAVNNFDARLAIRETWGKFALERGAFFYFMLGSIEEPYVQKRVEAEDNKYGDILQGTFIDSYYNLTLKTMSVLHWAGKYCSKIRYVLKVDDDMMINMQHVADFSEINPNFHRVIIGKLAKKWKPHRNARSKWFVPFRAFNGSVFPNFVTGPAYFLTGDAAAPLYETAMNDTAPLFLEDVYITGIVAEKANVRRYNHALMKNVHLNIDQCTYTRVMTSHKHSPNEIRQLWKLVYSKKCQYGRKVTPQSINATSTNNKGKQPPVSFVKKKT